MQTVRTHHPITSLFFVTMLIRPVLVRQSYLFFRPWPDYELVRFVTIKAWKVLMFTGFSKKKSHYQLALLSVLPLPQQFSCSFFVLVPTYMLAYWLLYHRLIPQIGHRIVALLLSFTTISQATTLSPRQTHISFTRSVALAFVTHK